jgi:hypothetical protein
MTVMLQQLLPRRIVTRLRSTAPDKNTQKRTQFVRRADALDFRRYTPFWPADP